MTEAAVSHCAGCGAQLAPGLLSCPGCGRLVHGATLSRLAGEASGAERAGEVVKALELWREALDLLPAGTQQRRVVAEKVATLSRAADGMTTAEAPSPAGARGSSASSRSGAAKGAAGIGGALLVLLSKGKLLLLGLTKLGTLGTMMLSLGVYWSAFGWRLAVGLVLSIYVHEMGHVAALRQRGFKATAPMFIPGLGALILLKQHPVDAREDARIGLAGPIWGTAAAIVALGVWAATGNAAWAAIARLGAWINLFNLMPVWQLDGSRGFRALSKIQGFLLAALSVGLWFVARDGLLLLLAVLLAWRAVGKDREVAGDRRTMVEFVGLMVILTAIWLVPGGVLPR